MSTHAERSISSHLRHLFKPGELLIIGLAVALALNLAAALRFLTSPVLNDFGVFYASGEAWIKGLDLYRPDLPLWTQHAKTPGLAPLNLNPPLITLAFVPLSLLPLKIAGIVWLGMNVGAFLWVGRLIVEETGADASAVLLLMGASGACITATGTGQLVWLLAVPMTVAWRAARRDDWQAAGFWIGVCAYAKPFLGIFLLQSLLRRRFGAVIGFAAAFLGAACAGLLFAGVPAHLSWLRAVNSVSWHGVFVNMSILGLFARTHIDTQAMRTLWGVLSAGLAAVTLVRLARRHTNVDREFLALLLLVLLVVPTGWVYYLVLVAGPVVALLPSFVGKKLSLASCGLFWPPLIVAQQPGLLISVTFDSIYLWAGLALWAMTVAADGGTGKFTPTSAGLPRD